MLIKTTTLSNHIRHNMMYNKQAKVTVTVMSYHIICMGAYLRVKYIHCCIVAIIKGAIVIYLDEDIIHVT